MTDPQNNAKTAGGPWPLQLRVRFVGPVDARDGAAAKQPAWLPIAHPDFRLLSAAAVLPDGDAEVGGAALQVIPGRGDDAASGLESENWARAARWQRSAQFHKPMTAGPAAPLAACTEVERVFGAVCPQCGAALEMVNEERTLTPVGLALASGHREYAWCRTCSSNPSAPARFYAADTLLPAEAAGAAAKPFLELADGWRKLLERKALVERDSVATAKELQRNFPCWTCSLAHDCYAARTGAAPHAHTRLAALHWSTLPILVRPEPRASLAEYMRRIEERSFVRAYRTNGTLDPAVASQLLEEKLALLAEIQQSMIGVLETGGAPSLALSFDAVWMVAGGRGAGGETLRPTFVEPGGVAVAKGESGSHAAIAVPPRSEAAAAAAQEAQKCSGTLSCLVVPRVVQFKEGFVKFSFEGKVAIASQGAPDPRDLAPQDQCLLSLPPGVGVSEIDVEVLPKASRPGELRFRTRDLILRPAVADELRRRLMRPVPDVLAKIQRLPGYEADLRAMARTALHIFLQAHAAAPGEIPPEEKALVTARRERPNDPAATIVADLRSTTAGSVMVDASKLFGAKAPKKSVDYYNRRKFPIEVWDELLGSIAGWMTVARSEASVEPMKAALAEVRALERKVRVFRLFLEPIGGWLEAIAGTEGDEEPEAISLDADALLRSIAEAADDARALKDGVSAARQLAAELKRLGVTARSLLLLRHGFEAPTSRSHSEMPPVGSIDDSGFYRRPLDDTDPTSTSLGSRRIDRAALEAAQASKAPSVQPAPASRAAQAPAPSQPAPKKIDRRGGAFLPLLKRLQPGTAPEMIARARSFATRADVLGDWADVLRLSIDFTQFLAECPEAWPSKAGKDTARGLLSSLRSGKHADACRAAVVMATVVREELAEQSRSVDTAIRTWALRNNPERLRSQTEDYVSTPGDRASADYWRHFVDQNKEDSRTLKNDLRRVVDSALRKDRKATQVEPLESALALAGNEEIPAHEQIAAFLELPADHLVQVLGGGTSAEAAAIAQEAASEPARLLAWTGLSVVGIEFLDWTSAVGATRGMVDEAHVARDVIEAFSNERAASYKDLYDGLRDIPRRHRAFLRVFADLDGPDWGEWFDQWTVPRIVAEIEKRVTKIRFPMTHAQERWRAFCRECDEGKYASETMRGAFMTRVLQLLNESDAA